MTCSRKCRVLLECSVDIFFMPMIINLLLFRDDEGELAPPPAKKPKTGSTKSVNSGPEASKEKASGVPEPSNALTRMLAKNKNVEASVAVTAPSPAAAAAPAEEHVSSFKFAFCFSSSIFFCYCSPPK